MRHRTVAISALVACVLAACSPTGTNKPRGSVDLTPPTTRRVAAPKSPAPQATTPKPASPTTAPVAGGSPGAPRSSTVRPTMDAFDAVDAAGARVPTDPVPAGARWVAPDGEDGPDCGATRTSACGTVRGAYDRTSAGGTIVLAGGTYRGVGNVGWRLSKRVTIMAAPGEQVVVSGLEPLDDAEWVDTGIRATGGVPVWRLDGVVTRGGEGDWGLGPIGAFPGVGHAGWIASDRPEAGLSEQLVVDGTEAIQRTSSTPAATLRTGEFVWQPDGSSGRGTVLLARGAAPAATGWATHRRAFTISGGGASGSRIVGVRFDRFASSMRDPDSAAYAAGSIAHADSVTLRDVTISNSSAHALYVGGAPGDRASGVRLERVSLVGNGAVGLTAYATSGLRIVESEVTANNAAGFNWESAGSHAVLAGVKITRSNDVAVVSSSIAANEAQGLWFDLYCDDITVASNSLSHNAGSGVFVEVSSAVSVVDNVVVGNGVAVSGSDPHRGGIVVGGSRDVLIEHNTLDANWDAHVVLYDDDETASPGRGSGRPAAFPWNPRVRIDANLLVDSEVGRRRLVWARRRSGVAGESAFTTDWISGSWGNVAVRTGESRHRVEVQRHDGVVRSDGLVSPGGVLGGIGVDVVVANPRALFGGATDPAHLRPTPSAEAQIVGGGGPADAGARTID